jgi:hypothetical protein
VSIRDVTCAATCWLTVDRNDLDWEVVSRKTLSEGSVFQREAGLAFEVRTQDNASGAEAFFGNTGSRSGRFHREFLRSFRTAAHR